MRIEGMAALLVLLVASTVIAGEATVATTATMPADLTGVWNLDTAESDDLVEQLEALRDQMMAGENSHRSTDAFGGEEAGVGIPGKRGGTSAGVGTGSPGRSSGHGAEGRAPADASGPRDLAQAMEQLLITVNGNDVEIMDGSDWTIIWTPGGQPVQRQGPGGLVVEQSWWDKDVLVLSTNGDRLVITRRLHLEDEGKTLVADVTVKLSGSSQRIDSRLVYSGY